MKRLFYISLISLLSILSVQAIDRSICDTECLKHLEDSTVDENKSVSFFNEFFKEEYRKSSSFDRLALLIQTLDSQRPNVSSRVLERLLMKDFQAKSYLSHLSQSRKNEYLCGLLDDLVDLSMGFLDDSCTGYEECAEHVSHMTPRISEAFDKYGSIQCQEKSLDEYITYKFDKELLGQSGASDESVNNDGFVSVTENCYQSLVSESTMKTTVKLSDEVVDILVESRNCSFDEQSEFLPEFYMNKGLEGAKKVTKNSQGKDMIYMYMQGMNDHCHLLLYALKNKEKNEAQSLEDAFKVFNLMFRGN